MKKNREINRLRIFYILHPERIATYTIVVTKSQLGHFKSFHIFICGLYKEYVTESQVEVS